MNTSDKPKQLFDYSLSGAQKDSWQLNKAHLHKCVVITTDASSQLASMVEQFSPDDSGWYVLLLEISGFKGNEWVGRPETIETIVGQIAPQEASTWVYILGGNRLAALVRIIIKTDLVAFVQKLGAALSDGQTSPRTRMAQVPAQKNVVKDYLNALTAAEENQKRQQEKNQVARNIAEISFDLQEELVAKRSARTRPVILLVEDDPVTLQLLKHLVAQAQEAEILAASNAKDAAILYRRNVPDMVVLDIGLPEIDGLTLLAKLREADPEARVVILTANAYRSNLEQATLLGARGFLAKPFTPAKISEVIKSVLKRKETS